MPDRKEIEQAVYGSLKDEFGSLLSSITKGKKKITIVEFACGSASATNPLIRLITEYNPKIQVEYIGLDVEKGCIDTAKQLHKNSPYKNEISFHCCDAGDLTAVQKILGNKKIDLAFFLKPEVEVFLFYQLVTTLLCDPGKAKRRVKAFEKMFTEVVPNCLSKDGTLLVVNQYDSESDKTVSLIHSVTQNVSLTNKIAQDGSGFIIYNNDSLLWKVEAKQKVGLSKE